MQGPASAPLDLPCHVPRSQSSFKQTFFVFPQVIFSQRKVCSSFESRAEFVHFRDSPVRFDLVVFGCNFEVGRFERRRSKLLFGSL